MKLLAFILILFFSLSARAERYAVIVDGGDDELFGSGPWLTKSSEKIAEQYRSRGYQVIVIKAEQKEGGQAFKDRLAALKNVESLDMAFLGHGAVLNAGVSTSSGEKLESELKRFPFNHLRPDEIERADIENLSSNVHFGYVMAPTGDEKSDWRKWIGMGDLHDAISKLKIANPNMQTTIRSLNCFGGNAIRAMESIPDVQVYSSSSAFHTSVTLQSGTIYSSTMTDYLDFFTNELETGKTYGEADISAKNKFLQNQFRYLDVPIANSIINFESLYAVPLSSIESHFEDECLGKPQAMNLSFCHEVPQTSEVQSLSRDVAQAMVMPAILEHIDLKKRYLDGLRSHGLCDGSSITLSLSLMQKGRDAIKKIARIPDETLKNYIEQELAQISAVKSLDDFEPFDEDYNLTKLLPHELQDPVVLADRLEVILKLKENLKNRRKRRLEEWQSVDFKKQLETRMTKIQEGPIDKQCSEDLVSCDISKLVEEWSKDLKDYPMKPNNLLSGFTSIGEEILKTKCPASMPFKSNDNAFKTQFDCISKISKQSPLEGLAALNTLRKSREGDNSAFCARIKKEKIILEKVQTCAKNYSKMDSDNFWFHLLSLRKMQLQSL